MSINSYDEILAGMKKIAYINYPPADSYPNKPENCYHNFNFVIYCDGIQDIVKCNKCGAERVFSCNFDDDYN